MLLFLIAAVVVVVMIGDMTVVVFVTASVVVIVVVVVVVVVVVDTVVVPSVSDTNHLAECLARFHPFQENTSLPPPLLQSPPLALALVLVLSWRKESSWL